MNLFDVQVSLYPNYTTADQSTVITLETWFKSLKYRDRVLMIRSQEDKKIRDGIKCTLPCITPSGVFQPKRGKEYLIQHSGFIQFDIDLKENPDINVDTWKQEIMNIGCAMCQLSVSGRGLWGLFRIEYPDKHAEHFNALVDIFRYYNITIDPSCCDVSRLRGYSYDPDTLFNPDAPTFKSLKETKGKKQGKLTGIIRTAPRPRPDKYDAVEYCIQEIKARCIDITAGYADWFALGCSLAAEYGERGRDYFHSISRYYPDYDTCQADKQYDNCMKGTGYTIATFFEHCRKHGILYAEKKQAVPYVKKADPPPDQKAEDVSVDNVKACKLAAKNPILKDLIKTLDLVSMTDQKGYAFS